MGLGARSAGGGAACTTEVATGADAAVGLQAEA